MNDHSSASVLYRYFFFDWLLRDVRGATDLERGLAIHHNRRAARWLPTYMYRWLWITLVAYGLAGAFDVLLHLPDVASCFYVGGGLGIIVNIALVTAWAGLTQLGQKSAQ